eukprot:4222003-Amphidinium_carterae.2
MFARLPCRRCILVSTNTSKPSCQFVRLPQETQRLLPPMIAFTSGDFWVCLCSLHVSGALDSRADKFWQHLHPLKHGLKVPYPFLAHAVASMNEIPL